MIYLVIIPLLTLESVPQRSLDELWPGMSEDLCTDGTETSNKTLPD